jgi:hypothetical protein
MFRSTRVVQAFALAGLVSTAAPASAQASKLGEVEHSERAAMNLLYVWDASVLGDRRGTRELLQFAVRHRFDTLAIEASPLGYGEAGALERYRRFSALAHGANLRLLALSGYPWFTVSAGAQVPGQPSAHEEGWGLYSACMASGLFDGLLDDSSPVETDYLRADGSTGNYFWDSTQAAARDYLVWLGGLQGIAGARLHVQAVPMWFDEHPALLSLFLEGETLPQSLAWYVARKVDLVNVLAYRDRADWIVDGVQTELGLGPLLVGLETDDLGPELDHATFFEEGRLALEREMLKVWEQLRSARGMRGFTVHHYGSLRELPRFERRGGGRR